MLHRVSAPHSQLFASIFAALALLHSLGGFSPFLGITSSTTGQPSNLLWLVTACWLLIYIWSAVSLILNHGFSWLFWLLKYMPIVCLMLIAAPISFLWSIDPVITVERSVHLTGTCLMAIYIGYHLSLAKICDCLAIVLAATMVAGFLLSLLFPDLGRSNYTAFTEAGTEVWTGIQGDKNGFAFTAVVTILLFSCFALSEKYSEIRSILFAIIFICFISLYFAHSITSTIALMVGLAFALSFMIWLKFNIHITAIFLSAAAVVFFGFVVFAFFGLDLFDKASWFRLIGRSEDFSGRIDIWLPTWELIKQNSLLGLGYGTIWFPRAGLEYQQQALLGLNWSAFHAHNGFLQIASQLGLPLAILSTWFVISVLVKTLRLYFEKPSPIILFTISFCIVFIIRNLFEVSIFVDRNFYWILFLAFSISTLRSYQALNWAK